MVYRAKEVVNPRAESVALIGKSLLAKQLLDDLRSNIGTDAALGLPPGPNSGLSVKLPLNVNSPAGTGLLCETMSERNPMAAGVCSMSSVLFPLPEVRGDVVLIWSVPLSRTSLRAAMPRSSPP